MDAVPQHGMNDRPRAVRQLHVPVLPHATVQRSSTKDMVVALCTVSILVVCSFMNEYATRGMFYLCLAILLLSALALVWFYVCVPIFLAVVRLWFSFLDWLLSADGLAIRLMRLQVNSDEIDKELCQPFDRDLAPDVPLDIQLEAVIEGEATEDRKRVRRQFYRRMKKETLIVKMVQHARRKVGTALTDRPETRACLDKCMRNFCADLSVRHCDRDNTLPIAIAMYFVPMESEIQAKALERGWFAWMQRMRYLGVGRWLWGFGSPAANLE